MKKTILFFVFMGIVVLKAEKETLPGASLFCDTVLHEIHLQFPQEYFLDSLVAYKDKMDKKEIKQYLQCNVKVDGKMRYACGVRYKGESSYDYYPGNKKSFKIKVNKFVKGQKHDGIKTFNLNNNFKDPTMLREKIMYEQYRKMGLTVPRNSFAKVWVNGTYYGLYSVVEQIDNQFLTSRFESKEGGLYKGEPKPNFNIKETYLDYRRCYSKKNVKKYPKYDDLIELIKAINEKPDTKGYAKKLMSLMDVDGMFKAWVLNNFYMNIDAFNMDYRHNFYIYRDPAKSKFEWIGYDFNYAFGCWSPTFVLKDMVELPYDYLKEFKKYPNPLGVAVLRENKHLKKRYEEIYIDYVTNIFNEEELKSSIDHYADQIRDAVHADTLKMYSTEEFEKNLYQSVGDVKDPGAFHPGLLELMQQRVVAIRQQLGIDQKSASATIDH